MTPPEFTYELTDPFVDEFRAESDAIVACLAAMATHMSHVMEVKRVLGERDGV